MRRSLITESPERVPDARRTALGGGGLHVLANTDAVGGVWTYSVDLARGLLAHDIVTTLAVAGPPPSAEQLADAASVPGLEIRTLDAALDWMAPGPRDVASGARRLSRLADAIGADILQLNSPALGAFVAPRRPVVAVCHSCVATWWRAVRGGDASTMPKDFRWRTDLVAAGLARADAIVAPTRAFADEVAAAYALERPPLVVHNGRAWPAGKRRATAWPTPIAFAAGRLWDEAKGAATLARAAAATGVPVVAAGQAIGPDGTHPDLSRLRLLGELAPADVRAWLARRPIFVSASVYEPFGLAVLEAAQAAAPLVLADIATFRELWDGAAVLVKPGDAAGFANAIGELAGDACFRHALGLAAERRAHRYSLDRLAAGMAAVYRRVLRERPAAANAATAAPREAAA